MVIKTNVSALTASRNLMETNKGLTASLARLSSGSKMANPADNAGGFAVSLRLDAQLIVYRLRKTTSATPCPSPRPRTAI